MSAHMGLLLLMALAAVAALCAFELMMESVHQNQPSDAVRWLVGGFAAVALLVAQWIVYVDMGAPR